jgi:mono/diheme cytochrome c family protein
MFTAVGAVLTGEALTKQHVMLVEELTVSKRYTIACLCLLALLALPVPAETLKAKARAPEDAGEFGQSVAPAPAWTSAEIATLRSLWIGSLPPLPSDPSNSVADDPRAVALGQKIFFDTRFSANGKVACASCHQPQRYFTDGLGQAEGVGKTQRSAPTIVGSAYSPWLLGRSARQPVVAGTGATGERAGAWRQPTSVRALAARRYGLQEPV